jgi:ubiquinone/menaquinone biosynthesis C-methylase UbiE
MGHYKNSKCRICGCTELDVVLPLKASPLADSFVTKEQLDIKQDIYDMDLYKCAECGLIQLLDVVHAEDIYIDYLYRTNTSMGLPEHFIEAAKSAIEKYSLKSGDFVLDIGSNDGSLLMGYKQLGMRVLGIDPAHEVAKEACARGIETLDIFFNAKIAKELVAKYGKANIITCNNLIANIDDLNDFAQGIKIMLADDGVFVSETSYILRLIDNMVFDTMYHEHLSYYGLKPLEYLFRKNGLRLVDAESIDTKGGSIRYAVVHDNSDIKESESLVNLQKVEEERGLYGKEIYKEYEARIEVAKERVVTFIDKALAEGKKVVGYGASNTTTTLLYHFELNDKIEYLLDDNKIKIGRFSPGSHIPVYSSDKLYEENPDYVIMFAWRFADMIMAKHTKYLENGGKFIIPLNEFREIGK